MVGPIIQGGPKKSESVTERLPVKPDRELTYPKLSKLYLLEKRYRWLPASADLLLIENFLVQEPQLIATRRPRAGQELI